MYYLLPQRRISTVHGYLWYYGLTMLIALILLGLFTVYTYRQTETTIELASSNEARILADQWETALRRVEATAAFIRDTLIIQRQADVVFGQMTLIDDASLARLAVGFPEIVALLVFDAQGHLQFSSDSAIESVHILDREYFQRLQAEPQAELLFSSTLDNKHDDRSAVMAHQAILGVDNELLGVIVIPLDLAYFQRQFAGIAVGSDGMISVRRSDNSRLVVRWPHVPEEVNAEARHVPPFVHVQQGNDEGVVRYIGATDHVERIFAFRKIGDYPFVMLVGRSVQEKFAPWRRSIVIAAVLTGGSLVLLALLHYLLRVTQTYLYASERHFQAMIQGGQNAVCRWLPDTTVTFCNTIYQQWFFPESEAIGQRWIEQVPAAARAEMLAQIEQRRAHPEVYAYEHRIVFQDGREGWVSWVNVPLCDARGQCIQFQSVGQDITERKRNEALIHQLAYFDALTQLPNRLLFLDRFEHALQASPYGQDYGLLLLLDLDHFKWLNDTQGHEVGDRLLQETAQRLRACVPAEATVARLGGDEFAVIVEHLAPDAETASRHAEQIGARVQAALTAGYDLQTGSLHQATPSIGITLFTGAELSAEERLKQAEVALYQAKDDGRNMIRFFDPAMQAAVQERAQLEQGLREALAHDELRLFLQPQVDQNGTIFGAEALLRWCKADGQLVSPAVFIPLAEETRLIVPIGLWVLEHACAQLQQWQQHPATRSLCLAINVSARQFHQPDFVSHVQAHLQRSGIDPTRLKLELTESVILGDVDETITRMQAIKALGVRFALDDFGTGYSSLSYLKRLPFDQLKIDQSFVRDMVVDASDAAIVRAILAMSRSLHLEVVAEGVETPAQRDALKASGCEMYQGYLFGKPLPIECWPDQPLEGIWMAGKASNSGVANK